MLTTFQRLTGRKYRIKWHAVRTSAKGYGTGRFTLEHARCEIKSMKEAQAQAGENLLYWTVER